MVCTSVTGHLKNYQFPESCKSWQTTRYEDLYTVPLEKVVTHPEIAENLCRQASKA